MPIKPNPYFLFIREQESKNPNFRGKSNPELVTLCAPLWDALPESERARWKERAKDMRASNTWRGPKEGLRDARGRSMAAVAEEEKEMRARAAVDRNVVTSTVAGLGSALPQLRILLMDLNLFYEDPALNAVLPAELSVVEFSLEEGLMNCFHEFVDPGEIPGTFSRAEIVQNAERSHRIQLGSDFLRSDYQILVSGLQSILFRSTDKPSFQTGMVFAMPGSKKMLEDSLRWLYGKAGIEYPMGLRVLDTSHLLHDLVQELAMSKEHAEDICPTTNMARMMLEAELWSYDLGLTCDHHSKVDVANSKCSLARVRRHAFIICAHCCGLLHIPLLPGRHSPPGKEELAVPSDSGYGSNDATLRSISESFDHLNVAGSNVTRRNDVVGNH